MPDERERRYLVTYTVSLSVNVAEGADKYDGLWLRGRDMEVQEFILGGGL